MEWVRRSAFGFIGLLPGFGNPKQLAHIPADVVEVADGHAVAGVEQQLGETLDDGRWGDVESDGLGDFGQACCGGDASQLEMQVFVFANGL